MVKISAVIITFNEEKNIARCLKSVKSVADEVIVMDSFSTDKTEEICRSFGVRFESHVFDGYIEQKNRANNLASNNFILSLDADEALTPELEASILKVKNNCTHDAYCFNRLTSYCGKWIKHGGWYPDAKIRLWDRRKGQWGLYNPHEQLILDKSATIKHLKGDLLHYSYYSIEEHLLQMNKFTSMWATTHFHRGKKVNTFSLIFKPFWRFIRNYFIKRGFLDGFYGYVVCKNTAHEVFLKYAKLKRLQKESVRKSN